MSISAEGELYDPYLDTTTWKQTIAAWSVIILLGVILSGCAGATKSQPGAVSQSQPEVKNLFDLTALCDGDIRYVAERRGNEIRERVSCEWSNNWEMQQ